MAKMINVEELKNAFMDKPCEIYDEGGELAGFSTETIFEIIDAAPAVEVEPVIHAHWIDAKGRIIDGLKMYVDGFYQCSACAKVTKEGKDFARCPNCGAHMDEAKVVE